MSTNAHLSSPDPEFQRAFYARCSTEEPGQAPSSHPISQDIEALVAAIRSKIPDAVAEARQAYAPYLPDESQYQITDHMISVDGGSIRARSITPTGLAGLVPSISKSTFPLLVYFHGGGFITGSVEENDFKLQILCVKHQVTIFNVDYRLAPENAFPIPLDDCMAAMKWAVRNRDALSADLHKGFVVMGASAGAQLAATAALRAREDTFFSDNPLTGQILQIPMTCHPDAYPDEYKEQLTSLKENANAPRLGANEVRFAWRLYNGPPTHHHVSPLLAPLHRLPPAFIQVTGFDPLRDDGLLYEQLLRKSGVATKLKVYPGVPHTFETAYPEIAAARAYQSDLEEGLRWLLELL